MKRLQTILFIGFAILVPARAQDGPKGVPQALPLIDLHIGAATLHTQVASTPHEEEVGLMYVSSMPDNNGMLFAIPFGVAQFWMKNTLIPLSVAFLDRSGTILEIHDMKALDETITRSDSDQVAYAIEANLHWFALNGLKPGVKIDPAPVMAVSRAHDIEQTNTHAAAP